MATHHGKLYAGADLVAFVSGVSLKDGGAGNWTFPGSKVLVSSDGLRFTALSCPGAPAGPCSSAPAQPASGPNVNMSFRSLASFNHKLYLGIFNVRGSELWWYDEATQAWTLEKKFSGAPVSTYHPAVAEQVVFKNLLCVGLGGGGTDYLHTLDSSSQLSPLPNLPVQSSSSNIGVLNLFSSSRGLLYVGNVDLARGFTLQTYDGVGNTVTTSGFGDPASASSPNAYAWTMADLNGRQVVGTLNTDFFNNLPRGSAGLHPSPGCTRFILRAHPSWRPGRTATRAGARRSA